MNFGVKINDCTRVTVGYTFMYWSGVARPADQLNVPRNLLGLPIFAAAAVQENTGSPTKDVKDTDFWIQGFNAGLEFRF